MSYVVEFPRNMPKYYYKLVARFSRCLARAQRESGNLEKVMGDLIVFGQGGYTPEQQQQDQDRAMQLLDGLKPKLN